MYGGLPPSIIESQVLVHVQDMKAQGRVMEVWTFAVTSQSLLQAKNEQLRLSRQYNICIRVFRGVKPGFPLSPWVNSLLFFLAMIRNQVFPSFIHARTEYAAAVAIIVKFFFPVRVIWDARGDSLSEHRLNKEHASLFEYLISQLRLLLVKRRLRLAAKHCDLAIFVSEQLLKLQGSTMPAERTIIIPCLADETLFYFSHNIRDVTRNELGYKDGDIVAIYVGSTAPWQCIPATVSLMEKVMRDNLRVKILIITPDRDEFELLFSDDVIGRVLLKTVSLSKVNRYLNAADYGIMLREPNSINFVASPVKFAEYSLTGLTVVTTKAVDQVNVFGSMFGNVISQDQFIIEVNEVAVSEKSRIDISNHAKNILSRGARVDIKSIYTR